MAIPTMVFSAYGMNLNLNGIPFSGSHDGFLIVILISLALSLVVALICSKKDLFLTLRQNSFTERNRYEFSE